MLAINIATFGSASAATPALKAGEEAVQVGTKFVAVGGRLAKVQKALWKTIDVLSKAAKTVKNSTLVRTIIAFKNNEAVKVGIKLIQVAKVDYNVAQDFKHSYAQDFATLTSQEINDELDRNFEPMTAKFVKENWADIQMVEMAQTNGFVIARDVLSYASIVDPTGVLSVVNAFTKPICGANVNWPTLSKSYK
jgi:hypothetical protein